jgi:hypothetical protein
MFNIWPIEYSIANVVASLEVSRDIVAMIESSHPITEQTSHPIARCFKVILGQQLFSLLPERKFGKGLSLDLPEVSEVFPILFWLFKYK